MTIGQICKLQPTESQYEILQRADRLLPHCAGRYFGGQLNSGQVIALTQGVELRKGTLPEPSA